MTFLQTSNSTTYPHQDVRYYANRMRCDKDCRSITTKAKHGYLTLVFSTKQHHCNFGDGNLELNARSTLNFIWHIEESEWFSSAESDMSRQVRAPRWCVRVDALHIKLAMRIRIVIKKATRVAKHHHQFPISGGILIFIILSVSIVTTAQISIMLMADRVGSTQHYVVYLQANIQRFDLDNSRVPCVSARPIYCDDL